VPSDQVVLNTTVGPIEVELWAREAPKACRNFVQLCMEGYYDGTVFHRVVKEFIAQGGDPTGTGKGGESIYSRAGKPWRDEFHSRLRFVRRGLVAAADKGSQFFFTLGEARELQNKHTIFGKVAGDTIYNMIRLEQCDTDAEGRPEFPQKIISAKVVDNPFSDLDEEEIASRRRSAEAARGSESEEKVKKPKKKGTK
jgi:peptidyl-prolyl cis-trans isomerase SDCCAG10